MPEHLWPYMCERRSSGSGRMCTGYSQSLPEAPSRGGSQDFAWCLHPTRGRRGPGPDLSRWQTDMRHGDRPPLRHCLTAGLRMQMWCFMLASCGFWEASEVTTNVKTGVSTYVS